MPQLNRKKTNQEFLEEVINKYGIEYIPLEQYKTKDIKIEFLHNKCKQTFKSTPHNFLGNSKCPYCTTRHNFKKKEKNNNDAMLFSFYKKYNPKKIDNMHLQFEKENGEKIILNRKWLLKAIKKNNNKPIEIGNNHKLSADSFSIRLLEKNKDLNVVKYTKYREPVVLYCNVCKTTFTTTPNDILYKKYCPNCHEIERKESQRLKSLNIYLNNFNKRCDCNEFQILNINEYENRDFKLLFKHICGNTFLNSLKNMTGNKPNGCPFCAKSYQEKRIEKFFIDNNIHYETQKKFKDCKDKNYLKFDFFLLDKNILLEYDGEFHYKPIKGIDSLNLTQQHDRIKNEFCQNNNLKLIRIPYFKNKNLMNILEFLKTTNNTDLINKYIDSLPNDYSKGDEISQQKQGQVAGEIPLNRNLLEKDIV